MALKAKPGAQLMMDLQRHPFKAALHGFLEECLRGELGQLVSAPPDARDVKTLLQGRAQMLAELQALVK